MNPSNPSVRVSVGSQAHQPTVQRGPQEEEQEVRKAITPPIDIHEAPEGLTLEADLPGATEDKLFIQLEDNVLSMHARVDSHVPDGARLLHQEFHVGDYYRSFILSDEVDRDRITAELKNGVLRLFLPKAERARTRRIEIKS
jgi:HSP20 family molecular chaperone IbpA